MGVSDGFLKGSFGAATKEFGAPFGLLDQVESGYGHIGAGHGQY